MPENGVEIDAFRILRKIPGGARIFFPKARHGTGGSRRSGAGGHPGIRGVCFPSW
jgi:hypothetical protein